MKKSLLTLLIVITSTYLYAQVEVSIQANSGLFYYSGASTASSSTLTQTANTKDDYTNNSYGNKQAFSYGFNVQTEYVTPCGFIIGVQTGYEILRSKVDLTGLYPYISNSGIIYFTINTAAQALPVPGTGVTYLQDQFITLSPFIGYRFHFKNIKVTVLPGIDVGFNTSSYDKGKLVTTGNFNAPATTVNKGTAYYSDLKLPESPRDTRLKMGLEAAYHKWGIFTSYAYGLTNYGQNITQPYNQNGISGGIFHAYSRVFKFGLSYQLI